MIVQGDLFRDGWPVRSPRDDRARSRDRASRARGLGRVRLPWPKAVAVLILANFLYTALLGPNGLMRWSAVHQQRTDRAAALSSLEAERQRLANHVRLLDPARADVDYVDELIRRDLGFARPDEVVLSH